jgi:PLP dependent protein
MTDRAQELRQNLKTVQERITAACSAAGRDPSEVTLVVITKFFPPSDVEILADLGVTDIGENKDQEAAAKVADLSADLRERLTVHFVGQLQTNKARSVARYADAVHSVDRPKLVRALDKAVRAAQDAGERTSYLPVLLQVDLGEGEQAGRGGAAPADLASLAETVMASDALRLQGLMAVAPLGLDKDGARAAFDRLMSHSRTIQQVRPDATWVSGGMSSDLELAISAGTTHLRVGTAILGSRPVGR